MDLLETQRPRTLLIVFCLLVWLPGLFALPPTDRDESRFAQASKQMIETGDYVRIMNGAEPRNRKPIGIYWLQVPFEAAARAADLATQNPIWPYRLPSILGGLLAVLATFELGQALVGRRAALLAGGMLAASIIVLAETHLAKTDAALLGATTLAMGLLARAYLRKQRLGWGPAALFWLAMGAGILLKGPITPMVAGLTGIALSLWDRRWRWLGRLRPGWGVLLMVLTVLPWFVAIGLATHGAFFREAIGGDLGNKLASGDDAHGAPPGLHLLLLPLLAFPSSFAVLYAIPTAWRARAEAGVRFLIAWVLPSWLVFEAVPTKLPHYTLPLYPAVALLAAWSVPAMKSGRRWVRVVRILPIVVAGVIGCSALALPIVLGLSPWRGVPVAVAALIVGWLASRPDGQVAALAAMPLFALAFLGWGLPRAAPLWIAPRVEAALATAGVEGKVIGSVGFHEPSLMFLAGTGTIMEPTAATGAAALASGQIAALLVDDRDMAAFGAEAGRLGIVPRAVSVMNGFNYSRGRWTALTLYLR